SDILNGDDEEDRTVELGTLSSLVGHIQNDDVSTTTPTSITARGSETKRRSTRLSAKKHTPSEAGYTNAADEEDRTVELGTLSSLIGNIDKTISASSESKQQQSRTRQSSSGSRRRKSLDSVLGDDDDDDHTVELGTLGDLVQSLSSTTTSATI